MLLLYLLTRGRNVLDNVCTCVSVKFMPSGRMKVFVDRFLSRVRNVVDNVRMRVGEKLMPSGRMKGVVD